MSAHVAVSEWAFDDSAFRSGVIIMSRFPLLHQDATECSGDFPAVVNASHSGKSPAAFVNCVNGKLWKMCGCNCFGVDV